MMLSRLPDPVILSTRIRWDTTMPTPSSDALAVKDYPLEALAQAYSEQGIGADRLDYYSTPDWFDNLAANCLQPSEAPLVLAAGGVAMPLRRRREVLGPVPGQAARSLSNFYSCRYTPPGLEALGEAAAVQAVAAIGRELRRRRTATLWFDALDEQPKDILHKGLAKAGWLVEPFPQFGNWHLDCAGLTFEDYWQARPGALRNTGKRRHRALVEKGEAVVDRFDQPDQAEVAIRAYEDVYARSWQGQEPFPGYTPGLIHRGLAAGELTVWSLRVGELPVASQIWVSRQNQATIFKLAYDQDWGKRSVGTVLTMAAMKYALENQLYSEIDLGWGDDDYKQQWLPQRRQRFGISAYNLRTPLGLARAVRNLGPRTLRKVIHRRAAK